MSMSSRSNANNRQELKRVSTQLGLICASLESMLFTVNELPVNEGMQSVLGVWSWSEAAFR